MIQGWRGKEAREIFETGETRGVAADVASRARRKLLQLDAASAVGDMAVPPSNRLHKLEGADVWSVSVTMQWRITFVWEGAGPDQVWFGDYH